MLESKLECNIIIWIEIFLGEKVLFIVGLIKVKYLL